MNNNDIVLDDSSGISVEEQKEILSQINGIAEENRKKLSQNASQSEKTPLINAKKKGSVFPLIVNISAIVIIGIGLLLLISFNSSVDSQARTGSVVYNFTERALIEEIRKSTAEQIAVKEMEIALISSRMEEIDKELLQLYSSNISLTSEQIAARERLLASQENFRKELSVLNEERSRILEASRVREAQLRAQLDERTREFAAAELKVSGELEAAMKELEQLTNEQQKLNAIDAHFAGSLTSISEMIQKSQYDQAVQSTANLREFINSSLASVSRSNQNRRDYYNQSIALLEVMITDARRNSGTGSGSEQFELLAKNAELTETINEMQRTINSFNAGSSGQNRRINELEETASTLRETVSTLRSTNTTLEQTSAEKDRTITTLQTERNTLSSTVTELRAANTTQEQEIANLRNQITVIRQLLQEN